MLESGVSLTAVWSRPLPHRAAPPVAGMAAIRAAVGETGVTSGFMSDPRATGYTATAGRWRRGAAGFVICAANEERLCYNADGTFRGQYLQGADTYYSAPWHDTGAAHTASDPAYLSTSAGGTIAYAGAHSEADLFGTTGKGVLLTQTSTANGFHTASNVKPASVAAGDVLLYEAIVSISAMTGAGKLQLRGANPAFAFTFNHDAAGEITGHDSAGQASDYNAGYHRLGTINGKVWTHVWVARKATSTGNATVGIGFSADTAQAGRKFHVCELMVRKNPVCAPVAVPVCAAAKTFAADTLATSISGTFGASFLGGVGRCRTKITDGNISLLPDGYVSSDGEPLVTSILLHHVTESADRAGLLPNRYQRADFFPWGNPAPLALNLGPARFQIDVATGFGVATLSTMTITSAFRTDPMLYGWFDGRVNPTYSYQSGAINLDDLLLFPTTSPLADQFEQVDIGLLHAISTNGTSFSSQRSLWMSHPASHSRARHQVQADDDLTLGPQAWMGQAQIGVRAASISVNISDSMFACMARALNASAEGSSPAARPIQFVADRVFYWSIWSDSGYIGYGNWAGSSFDTQFHGRFTCARSDLYQSRQEVQVDVGSGWQNLSATALTENSLPIGREARHAGTWNFGSSTLNTATANPARTTIIRSWNIGSVSGGPVNHAGFQFHASPIPEASYDRYLAEGECFVIEQADGPSLAAPWVRVVADTGYWNGSARVVTANPAFTSSGTHADCWQTITQELTLTGVASDGMVILGDAQGPFMQGGGTGGSAVFGEIDFTNFVCVTPQANAFVLSIPKGTPDVTLTNALVMPAKQRGRYSDGSRGSVARIGASQAPSQVTIANVHYGSNTAAAGDLGGTITGTADLISLGTVTNFDQFTDPTGSPTEADYVPAQFIDPVSKVVDLALVGDPRTSGFRFTAQAESDTGMALNALLDAALATGNTFKNLHDAMMAWQRDPDVIGSVSASAAVGTAISLKAYERFRPESLLGAATLAGTGWLERFGGNEAGYFALDGSGGLTVARSLAGLNRLFLLMTDAEEMIVVDVS